MPNKTIHVKNGNGVTVLLESLTYKHYLEFTLTVDGDLNLIIASCPERDNAYFAIFVDYNGNQTLRMYCDEKAAISQHSSLISSWLTTHPVFANQKWQYKQVIMMPPSLKPSTPGLKPAIGLAITGALFMTAGVAIVAIATYGAATIGILAVIGPVLLGIAAGCFLGAAVATTVYCCYKKTFFPRSPHNKKPRPVSIGSAVNAAIKKATNMPPFTPL